MPSRRHTVIFTLGGNQVSPDSSDNDKADMDEYQEFCEAKTTLGKISILLTYMKVFGLYFERQTYIDVHTSTDMHDQNEAARHKTAEAVSCPNMGIIRHAKRHGSAVWCVALCAVIWINVFRLLPSFHPVGSLNDGLFIKVVIVVWYTQCASYSTICLLACFTSSRLPLFFSSLSQLSLCHTTAHRTHNHVRLFLLAFGGLLVANIALLCYLLFSDNSSTNLSSFTDVLYTPVGSHPVMQIILLPVHVISLAAWFLPLALFCVLSTVCETQLTTITRLLQLSSSKARKPPDPYNDLELIRLRHVQLSDVIQCMNDVYCGFTAISYTTNVPLGCFCLYMIIWPEQGSVVYLTVFSSFILLMALVYVVIVSHKAASIVCKAHEPFSLLHHINTSDTTHDTQFQIHLFLCKLRGPPIGISALNIFTIDRTSLLTIGSIVATYFALLVQFKMPNGSCTKTADLEENLNTCLNLLLNATRT